MLTNLDPIFLPFVYLVLALLLGCALGLERSFAGKSAGVRTFGLVSMGSCLFVLVTREVLPMMEGFNVDPLRMAAGIVAGIGFLCAGAIFMKDSHVSGLTTATGLWVSAGVGMAVGYSLVALAVFATLATLIVFTLFWFIEYWLVHIRDRFLKK